MPHTSLAAILPSVANFPWTPASPAAGYCTVPVSNPYNVDGSTNLTLTYTTTPISVNGRAQKR